MVDISSITGYTQASTTSSDLSDLSADMNTFLTLLTTQLQYQDPLDPMDTAEFTNQLVQYSQVEQSIQTNQNLEELLLLNISNLGAQAVSYIGKVAQVMGDIMPLEDGSAMATYNLDKDVISATIVVTDMEGNIVYSEAGGTSAGNNDFVWDGKDSDGNQLEDGAYKITVNTTVAPGDKAAGVVTTVYGRVTGVASDENGVYLGLGNVVTATLSDLLTIRVDDHVTGGTDTDTDTEVDPDVETEAS